ncbi:MAG: cytochrome P450, partial [Pirellulaceae bacterium]
MHTQQIQKPIRIKLADVEYRQNPREAFGRLREQGPVFRGRMPVMGKVWFAVSWQAASDVLRKTDDFVRDPKNAGKKKYAMIQSLLPRTFSKLANNLLGQDGADHRRLRSLVDQAFQRQNIRQLESRIETICQQQLDLVANISSDGTLPVDIIEHYARPVPLIVICELLGLPDEDRPKFMKWFEGFANVGSLTDIFKMLPSIRRTLKYLEKQFDEVRRQPRDGLISALVQAELDGEKLSRDELLSMATLLLLAGHETTVHLISNSILTLLELPEALQQLTSDWSLADSFIEEVLRYCSP